MENCVSGSRRARLAAGGDAGSETAAIADWCRLTALLLFGEEEAWKKCGAGHQYPSPEYEKGAYLTLKLEGLLICPPSKNELLSLSVAVDKFIIAVVIVLMRRRVMLQSSHDYPREREVGICSRLDQLGMQVCLHLHLSTCP